MTNETGAAKPAPQLIFATSADEESVIVRCTGKLVATTTGVLQAEIRGLLPSAKRVVLDLTDLGYMDSSGLGTIIGLYVSAKSAGSKLEVINLSQRVRHLFSITNVLSLFETCGEQNIRLP